MEKESKSNFILLFLVLLLVVISVVSTAGSYLSQSQLTPVDNTPIVSGKVGLSVYKPEPSYAQGKVGLTIVKNEGDEVE